MPEIGGMPKRTRRNTMALRALIDSIEGLHESVVEHYSKGDDGKYRLDVTEVAGLALEDISGLRTGLEKERQKSRDLETKLVSFKDIDPKNVRDLEAKVQEMNNWTPDDKVQSKIESSVAEVVKQHETKLNDMQKRETSLLGALNKELVASKVVKAITENKGSVELLESIVSQNVRMRENADGSFSTEIVKADGTQRLNSKGDALGMSEYVKELRNDKAYARAFDGSDISGGGAQPQEGSRDFDLGGKDLPIENMNPIEGLSHAHAQLKKTGS